MKQILLIDDDAIINYLHSHILRSKFPTIPIIVFENGLKALEYLNNNGTFSYLIFLDINMPIMDGWGFLDAFGAIKTNNDFHIAILTSSINGSDRDKSSEYDLIFEFLTKPLKLEDIQKFKNYSFLLPFFNNGA